MRSRSVLPAVVAVVLLSTPHGIRGQETDVDPETEILGGSAAFSLIDEERQRIWLRAGSSMFQSPDARSDLVGVIDALCEIEVLERSGDWHKVHHDGRLGWVDPKLPAQRRGPNALSVLEPILVETPGFDLPDPSRRRELAQLALGLPGPNGRLGPWELLTDVDDPALIDYLDRIAGGLATSYRDRVGLEPAQPTDQTVALFSTEEGYRPFESEVTHLAGLGARGHAGGGLAALFIENNRLEEAGTLLVHELTHLMNRSALGPNPPPWVEEGIANDLAYSRIDRNGRLRLGSINGERITLGGRRTGISIQYTGATAALTQLLRIRSQRRGTPLKDLVGLDQSGFLEPDRWRQHYIESAFLVRFLLEGEKRRFSDGFRRYLTSLGGEAQTRPILIDLLETDWDRLERGFSSWLQQQSVELLR